MANVWINEFHYDNGGTDTNEFIEIAGLAGTDLTGWRIVAYNGNNGLPYASLTLSGTIGDTTGTGHGFASFTASQFTPSTGSGTVSFQNGNTDGTEPDGFAIFDNNGNLVEFISYEGVISATINGAAVTSVNVGVYEGGSGSATGSIQRKGSGYDSTGFTDWDVLATDNTATKDAANAGQTFNPFPTGQLLSIAADDAAKDEGNDGTTTFTFTVTRTNLSGDVTVDWSLAGLGVDGWASLEDFVGATTGQLTFTGSEITKQISITVKGDTAFEFSERFSVALSNATAGTTITTGTATSTIRNDDPIPIYQLQGRGHTSSYAGGDAVTTTGVITAIQMTGTTRGFYIQDVKGDGDATTSDAIFVFCGSNWTPNVEVGDAIKITGKITEYRPSSSPTALSLTQFSTDATYTVTSKGNALPNAVVLGPNGLKPPTGDVTAAAAFYESLEGMRVTIEASRVVGATNNYGEIWTAIEGAYDPSSLNGRGGLSTNPTDSNPELIQIDNIRDSLDLPMVDVGARLGAITGVMSYGFSSYEVLVGTTPVVTQQSTLQPEQTDVTASNEFFLSFGTYNVENLDVNDDDGDADVDGVQFAKIASHIVKNMGSPHVLALQEIQDDSGTVDNGVVSADKTLQKLVDEIAKAGGPRYKFAYLNPENGKDGGAEGGNIRQAFLYNDDVVDLVPGSLERITDPDPTVNDAFQASRKPLVAKFVFDGETYTFINNHLNSKGGDDPVFGTNNPPVLNTEAQRIEQAKLINAYVDRLLAADPNANVAVLGDLNDFAWSNPLKTLSGEAEGTKVLFNLAEDFIANPLDRTDYVYNGNSQSLDHIYVSAGLRTRMEGFDIVRINSEFDADQKASDHDALVARSTFRVTRVVEGSNQATGDAGSNALIGSSRSDILRAGLGRDYLQGGSGDDLLDGGAGADGLYGGDGIDTASYAEAGSGVTVNLATRSANTGDAAGDSYSSIENLLGSSFADVLVGNDAANSISGGFGADRMHGGGGNDTYFVENSGDQVIEAAGGGMDTIMTTIAFTLGATDEIETLIADGQASIALTGNAFANTIVGNAGANKIHGGLGNDILSGGSGKDVFVFDTKANKYTNMDRILDFNAKDDIFHLDNKVFTKLGKGTPSKPVKFNSDMFVKGTKAKDKEDRVIYDAKSGALYYDEDGTGRKAQVKIATLDRNEKLTYADFFVI